MLIIKYINVLLLAICFHIGNAQTKTVSLSAQLAYCNHNTFGNNIYAQNHDKSAPFLALQIEAMYKKKAFINFTLANAVHYSNTKKYIQNSKTTIKQRLFGFGYHFHLKNWFSLSPSLYLGSGKGENDGKFNGFVYGCGAQATFRIWKDISAIIKTDYLHYNFGIRSTPDLEPLFNHTFAIIPGCGLRFNF